MRRIIHRDLLQTHPDTKLKLYIYYKIKKLRSLFIKNNIHKPSEVSPVVYRYNCDQATCMEEKISFIGHTTTRIKERFEQHAPIKKQFSTVHGINIKAYEMSFNVTFKRRAVDTFQLYILEALLIKENNQVINHHANDFDHTLNIFC